jgi:hypothetical protein
MAGSEKSALISVNAMLYLDEFGQRALDRFARRGYGSNASALRTACLYYLSDRDTGRPGWRAPRFATGSRRTPGLNVELDDETWRELAAEADRQGVLPEALGVHALLYFVADVDSGRLAERLGHAPDCM